METKIWSEIHLDFSPDRFRYKFNMNQNGLLEVLSYSKFSVDSDGIREYDIHYRRIPLK
jgi:hypothetical protein